jgi:SEC-C motif
MAGELPVPLCPRAPAYCVMSVSSKADAEGGKWSAWVATVVAQRGGEVDRPGPAEHADDQVAQAGHDLRGSPGADLGAILGEGHIPDPVQAVLDRPVAPPEVGKPGRAGLGEGEAGDRVRPHGPPPPGVQATTLAGDLDDLRGMREPELGLFPCFCGSRGRLYGCVPGLIASARLGVGEGGCWMAGLGRNERCPCGSGRKVKRCCGVQRGPSEDELAKAFLAVEARAAAWVLRGHDDEQLDELHDALIDLPSLDPSLLWPLPRLLTPRACPPGCGAGRPGGGHRGGVGAAAGRAR